MPNAMDRPPSAAAKLAQADIRCMSEASIAVRSTCAVDAQRAPADSWEWHALSKLADLSIKNLRALPPDEFHRWLVEWAKRRQHLAESSSAPAEPEEPRFTHRPWPGCRDWQNWAIGLDGHNKWHLFHFQRWGAAEAVCQWRHHNNAAIRIASGKMHWLAVAFIANPTVPLAQTSKALVSRLREAIRVSVGAEGHRPKGKPIQSPAADRPHYQAIARFGSAEYVHRRWLLRLAEAEPAKIWLPLGARDAVKDYK